MEISPGWQVMATGQGQLGAALVTDWLTRIRWSWILNGAGFGVVGAYLQYMLVMVQAINVSLLGFGKCSENTFVLRFLSWEIEIVE